MENIPLYLAARSGDLDKGRELLETGKYNVNNECYLNETPLLWCLSRGALRHG